MDSQIAQAIKLKNQPVAVVYTDSIPDGALQFQPGVWGCVIAMLTAASKGRVTAFTMETTTCPGGKVGLGFCGFQSGMEHFLSTGTVGPKPGEFYKKSPELALDYMNTLPFVTPWEHIVLKPLSVTTENENIRAVVFLVNADRLSGLTTLANFDRQEQDGVRVTFGAGCVQALRYAIIAQEQGSDLCSIGLTDPSSRKCVDQDLLSFSIPYHRFLQMEQNVTESFLTKEIWRLISRRLE